MSIISVLNPHISTARVSVSAGVGKDIPSASSLAQTAYDLLLTPAGQRALLAVENHKGNYEDALTDFDGAQVGVSNETRDLLLALAEQFVYGTFTVQTDEAPAEIPVEPADTNDTVPSEVKENDNGGEVDGNSGQTGEQREVASEVGS